MRNAAGEPRRGRAFGTAIFGFLVIGGTASQQGGYFLPAWGLSALGLLLAIAAVLVFSDSVEWSRSRAALLAGLALVAAWTAVSIAWSDSLPRTMSEVERTFVYVTAIAAMFAVASRARAQQLFVGMLTAIVTVSVHALFVGAPSGFATGLAGLVGYGNALGILDAIAILLALGLASHSSRTMVRLVPAAAVPLLVVTLYLTQSRGAAAALICGLVLFLALDHRLRHGVLVVIAVVIVGGGILVMWSGGPAALVTRAVDAFTAPISTNGRADATLLSLSGNERAAYWHVAWDEYAAHPWFGSGAGTFAIYWYRDRDTIYGAQDAHSLYLETLAETGPLGLAILLGALAIPILSLRRVARGALERAGAAAYVAFLLHAAIDWDWEMPAVTIAGLFCGGALLLCASGRSMPISNTMRVAGLLVLSVLTAFAIVTYAGNVTVQASVDAANAGDLPTSKERARSATRWTPWSTDAWRLLGEAEQGDGDLDAARRSFRRAISIDSNDWKLWYELALASAGIDRQSAFAEAERLNPLEARNLEGR